MIWVNSNNIKTEIYYYHFIEEIEGCLVTLFLSTHNRKIRFDVVNNGLNQFTAIEKSEQIPEDIRNVFELYMNDPLFEIELKREIERQK